eukprot:TRINITY_DN6752_c0_g1_i1.p1 TRINITY_DN6752_c0_g1~~TRINITY_DN6752_c0_g1_i1.p1  ORF type:complete len:195 (-),score=65.35 TRINITY_DN6752_c0_g1_i1:300-884(-)
MSISRVVMFGWAWFFVGFLFFFFQAEDGIRDVERSRGLGDVYKRQIEAEKAGEYGKGFAVVAREIRRLADQTAVATLDIIKMVKDMESAVSAGVMGMEKFSGDVRASVKDTEQISTQIESVIIKVQGLPEKFDLVIDGMKQQTTGAQQISDAMVQLNDCAHSTSDSLRAFNEAAEQLNKATLNLQKELAIFKVK